MITASLLSILIGTSVLAPSAGDDGTLEALKICSKLKDNNKRLTCYDLLLGANTSQNIGNTKSEFGLKKQSSSLKPKIKVPTKPTMKPGTVKTPQTSDEPSAMKKLLDTIVKKDTNTNSAAYEVKSHKKASNGTYIFTMKDGSIWRQTDAIRRPLKRGPFAVTISKGSFGSYTLRPEKGSWSIRVKRIK